MNNKTVLSYCLGACLVIATTGCNCQKDETKNESINQSPIETTQESTTKPQDQSIMNTPQRVTTPSGLIYVIIKESKNDKKPTKGSNVTVHYTGWLADAQGNARLDKKFDSSRDRNQPFQFTIGVGKVIKGWDEGVMDMKIGERRLLIIPASLAYGNRAVGGDLIPANSTLVFDVELIDVK